VGHFHLLACAQTVSVSGDVPASEIDQDAKTLRVTWAFFRTDPTLVEITHAG
jgi:hypothetical protein